MPHQTPKHGAAVKAAIKLGVQEGLSAAEIGRRLEAGTLQGLAVPYPMPQSTVEYYCRRAKKDLARATVTNLAQGSAAKAIDHLARQLISEAEIGIAELRMANDRDPEKAKRWGDLLKTLQPLMNASQDDEKPKRKKRQPVPDDDLSTRLLTAQHKPEPTPSPLTSQNEQHQPSHDTTTPTATPTNTPSSGVAAQTAIRASSWPPSGVGG